MRRPRGPAASTRALIRLGAGSAGQADYSALEHRASLAAEQPTRWELWFVARPGPWRLRKKTIGGLEITQRTRRPELPPSQNDHVHPQTRGTWVKDWRKAGREAATAHRIPPCARIRVSAVVYRRALGTADEDNDRSRLKPILDGLRDAGVIPNDTRGYVEHGTVTEERAGTAGPGVLLIVEALEGER